MIEAKIKGCIFGLSIGDALGSLTEELDKQAVRKAYGGPITTFVDFSPYSVCPTLKKGQYCHKTQIFLISLETLIENKRFDEETYVKKLINWLKNEKEHRYPSGAHINAALSYLSGANPEEARVNSSEFDGTVPAIAAGLFYWFDSERAIVEAKRMVNVTHEGNVVLDVSGIIALAISKIISGIFLSNSDDKIEFIEFLMSKTETSIVRSYLNLVQSLIIEGVDDLNEAILKLGNGNFSPEVLSLSLFIFLKNTSSFRNAVLKAANAYGDFGGCTSGIGFLTGALSGALLGIESIPSSFINDIENNQYLHRLSEKIK